MTKIATIGAAYSANKGAASMLQALLDNLAGLGPETDVAAVSTHAEDDRRAYESAGLHVRVASQAPVEMAAVQVPLAVLIGILRQLHLPYRLLLRPHALRVLHDADVVADLSGISFVDGRRFVVLVYNALVVWVPMLLGTPVVKCAQAMGPFEGLVNGALARATLPRLTQVCPRGDVTESHVRELGLDNVTPASDLAFAMNVTEQVRADAAARLAAAGPGPYLVLSPSQVVATYCAKRGIPYARILSRFIDDVTEATDYHVVMLAHSAQPGRGVGHMNDLPLCREIAAGVRAQSRLIFFDEDLLPTTLRAIIGAGDLIVTSRFHAMISALAEGVPPLVIGWSHKYAEVLAPFGLEDSAITYDEIDGHQTLVERTLAAVAQREDARRRIGAHLPHAKESALTNVRVLAQAVEANSNSSLR